MIRPRNRSGAVSCSDVLQPATTSVPGHAHNAQQARGGPEGTHEGQRPEEPRQGQSKGRGDQLGGGSRETIAPSESPAVTAPTPSDCHEEAEALRSEAEHLGQERHVDAEVEDAEAHDDLEAEDEPHVPVCAPRTRRPPRSPPARVSCPRVEPAADAGTRVSAAIETMNATRVDQERREETDARDEDARPPQGR